MEQEIKQKQKCPGASGAFDSLDGSSIVIQETPLKFLYDRPSGEGDIKEIHEGKMDCCRQKGGF